MDRTNHRSSSIDLNSIPLVCLVSYENENTTERQSRTSGGDDVAVADFVENSNLYGRNSMVGLDIDDDDDEKSLVSEQEMEEVARNYDEYEYECDEHIKLREAGGNDYEDDYYYKNGVTNNRYFTCEKKTQARVMESRIDRFLAFENTVPANNGSQGVADVSQDTAVADVTGNKTEERQPVESKVLGTTSVEADDGVPIDGCKDVRVRFGSVEIHVLEPELRGSSVPMRGPPLHLGRKKLSYQKYESVDAHHEDTKSLGGRRKLNQLLLSPQERIGVLLECGYTMREIQSSVRKCGIVRTARIRSARYSSRNNNFLLGLQTKLRAHACSKSESKTKKTARIDVYP